MTEDSKRRWHPSAGLTLFGRKPALEALMDPLLEIHCLHLANSNRSGGIITQIMTEAERRGVETRFHDRQALSRISKNGRQDQGVALDVICPGFQALDAVLASSTLPRSLLALDGITNPQNVGMIIRSAVAAGIDGVLYPQRGIASLGPLVIKASAGTIFRAPIIRCDTTLSALSSLKASGFHVAILDAHATGSIYDLDGGTPTVCVLGGESHGISTDVRGLADAALGIPMANGVESLNVAVTGALVAFQMVRSAK